MENCTNCTNATVPGIPVRDEFLAQLEIGIQATIFTLAVIGNGGVLLILALRRKKLTRMNMLIVHLSIADLFVAFFNVLPQLIWDITYTFQGEAFLCGFVKLTQTMAMYASSYVLVVTAIDRYTALCHPLVSQTWTMKKIHLMVAVAWILSFIFSIPQPIIFRYVERAPGVFDCWANFNPMWTMNLYVTWFFVAVYMIPICILTFCYGRISCVVWKNISTKEASVKGKKVKKFVGADHENGRLLNGSLVKQHSTGNKPRAHVRGSVSRAKIKTVKLTLTVVFCYLICWSPFFIAQLWWAWDENAPFTGKLFTFYSFFSNIVTYIINLLLLLNKFSLFEIHIYCNSRFFS